MKVMLEGRCSGCSEGETLLGVRWQWPSATQERPTRHMPKSGPSISITSVGNISHYKHLRFALLEYLISQLSR